MVTDRGSQQSTESSSGTENGYNDGRIFRAKAEISSSSFTLRASTCELLAKFRHGKNTINSTIKMCQQRILHAYAICPAQPTIPSICNSSGKKDRFIVSSIQINYSACRPHATRLSFKCASWQANHPRHGHFRQRKSAKQGYTYPVS